MKYRNILSLVLAGALTLSLAACGTGNNSSNSNQTEAEKAQTTTAQGADAGQEGTSQAASGEAASTAVPEFPEGDVSGLTIGFSYRSASDGAYMTTYFNRAVSYAKEKGIKLVILDALDDVTKQTTQIQDLIQQKCDVIVIWPVNSEASVAQAMQVKAAGIPCVTANTDVVDEGDQYVTCFVGPSNYEEGYLTGKAACEEMAAKGITNPRILYVDGHTGNSTMMERKSGMKTAVEEAGGTFLDDQSNDGSREKAQQIAENWLVKFKADDFDAVMCYDDNAAIGVYNAAKAAGREDEFTIYAAACGESSTVDNYIAKGYLGYMALQSPLIDAESAIDMAANVAAGYEPTQHEYYIDTPVINKDNYQDFYISWASSEK